MKPRQVIVDENDQIISHKFREEIVQSDIYRVAALWITNSKGDILLAQRALSKKNDPGRWGPAVTGTVDEGETYETNIVKEAEEELGLKNIQPQKGPKVRVAHSHNFFDQWFLLTVDQPIEYFKAEPKEVMAIKWFTPEEFEKETTEHPEQFLKSMPQWKKLFKKES
jgi:isopentenyl-diphosphate delta-isomerase